MGVMVPLLQQPALVRRHRDAAEQPAEAKRELSGLCLMRTDQGERKKQWTRSSRLKRKNMKLKLRLKLKLGMDMVSRTSEIEIEIVTKRGSEKENGFEIATVIETGTGIVTVIAVG